MAKLTKQPLTALADYLPDQCYDDVVHYLQTYKVHLSVTQARTSVLGNYRNAHGNKNHRISVNGNLNKFSFLITLLHELAHLLTFEKHQHAVFPHGREWKNMYGQLLSTFLRKNIFPEDIAATLITSLHNPGASTCSEEGLMRILRRYDVHQPDIQLIEDLKNGDHFVTRDGRAFERGEKQRTRYMCTEINTKKLYLFNALYEVKKIEIGH